MWCGVACACVYGDNQIQKKMHNRAILCAPICTIVADITALQTWRESFGEVKLFMSFPRKLINTEPILK